MGCGHQLVVVTNYINFIWPLAEQCSSWNMLTQSLCKIVQNSMYGSAKQHIWQCTTACNAVHKSASLFSESYSVLSGLCLNCAKSTFSVALLFQKIESTVQCVAMGTQPLLFRLYFLKVCAFTTLQGTETQCKTWRI